MGFNDNTTMGKGDHNRRLHVVFVLDTTVSMDNSFDGTGKTLRDHMNKLVADMMEELVKNPDYSPYAYVSFVTFADGVTMESDFMKPSKCTASAFRCVDTRNGRQGVSMTSRDFRDSFGDVYVIDVPVFHSIGTPTLSRIGSGVQYAIEKLQKNRERIRQANTQLNPISLYSPVMVLITDGAPGDTVDPEEEKKAMRAVYDHCFSTGNAENLIFPVICGIGDQVGDTKLKFYSQGYHNGWVPVDRKNPEPGFHELFAKITVSMTKSIDLNSEYITEAIKAGAKKRKGSDEKHETYRKPPDRQVTLNDLDNL